MLCVCPLLLSLSLKLFHHPFQSVRLCKREKGSLLDIARRHTFGPLERVINDHASPRIVVLGL